jgi:hypothetical protein
MMNIQTQEEADRLLDALGEQLTELGARFELVVVGGSALMTLELVTRPTQDVDVVALHEAGTLETATPLPEELRVARDRVARDFGLPESWLNDGPASLLDLGLPAGFMSRAVRRDYGPSLTVWFASRLDQVHFKLYATVDSGPGRHEADLRALGPTREELLAAAEWSRTHDPSPAYRSALLEVLEFLGVSDATLGA